MIRSRIQFRRQQTQQRLAEITNRSGILQAEEAQLLLKASEVRTELGRLQSEALQLHNAAAPVSFLPPEVLAEIFKYLKNDPRDRNQGDIVAVSRVMCGWRVTALAIPLLWTTIIITDSEESASMAKIFFERAKPLLVKVKVIWPDDYVGSDIEESSDAGSVQSEPEVPTKSSRTISVLKPRMDRIHSLSIKSRANEKVFREGTTEVERTNHVRELLQSFKRAHAPSLRRLEVDAPVETEEDEFDGAVTVSILNGGPTALSELILNRISLRSCWPPESQITRLSLREPYDDGDGNWIVMPLIENIDETLSQFSSLTHLELLGEVCSIETLEVDLDIIDMPLLEFLTFGLTADEVYFKGMMDLIDAPNLKSFNLKGVDNTVLKCFIKIVSDGEFPCENLQQLSFDGIVSRDLEVITPAFARATGSITHLSFNSPGNGISQRRFDTYRPPGSKFLTLLPLVSLFMPGGQLDPSLWPNLHMITYGCRLAESDTSSPLLHQLVEARSLVGPALQLQRIHFYDNADREVDFLDDLEQGRMEFVLEHP